MNNFTKTALALIAALALSAHTSRAGEGAQPARLLQNLITDDSALDAWTQPGLTQPVAEISFDLPLNEVAHKTLTLFTNKFDLILPSDPDPSTVYVKLELKNVNALEIFNAMNMYFETGNLPAHWKLTLNGSRPTAILEMKKPPVTAAPAQPEKKHTVFSIADILPVPATFGNDEARVMELDKRAEWITGEVNQVLNDIKTPPYEVVRAPIQIHAQAGLLIFTGTAEETELVRSTLEAMKQTVRVQEEERAKADAARKAPENLKK